MLSKFSLDNNRAVAVLDLVLQNFDYHRNKQAPAAIACRLLAASVNHYREKLQEVEQ